MGEYASHTTLLTITFYLSDIWGDFFHPNNGDTSSQSSRQSPGKDCKPMTILLQYVLIRSILKTRSSQRLKTLLAVKDFHQILFWIPKQRTRKSDQAPPTPTHTHTQYKSHLVQLLDLLLAYLKSCHLSQIIYRASVHTALRICQGRSYSNACNNPREAGPVVISFMDEKAKAQRGHIPHSWVWAQVLQLRSHTPSPKVRLTASTQDRSE